MPEYEVIKKGRIRVRSDVPVKAESWVLAKEGGDCFILLKLNNKSKAALDALSFTVKEYDEGGVLMRTVEVEKASLEETGRFVFPQKIAAEEGCADITVEVNEAAYGSYCYRRKGKAAVLEYDGCEYNPPVYDPSAEEKKMGGSGVVAVRKSFSVPLLCFFIVIIFACLILFMWDHLSYYGADSESFREDDVVYEFVYEGGEIAGVTAADYSGVTGVVVIPETVSGYTVISVSDCAFADYSITRVTIKGSVTIASNAFRNCTSLTTVSIGGEVTIGSYAFYNCTSLTTVNAPEAVSVGAYAFWNCKSLSSVSLGTTEVGEYAFYHCSSLNSFNGVITGSIGQYAFYNCTSLGSINAYSATSIGDYAFYDSGITAYDFYNVTYIGLFAFAECQYLTYAEFDNEQLVIDDCAFYNSSLYTVKVYALYSIALQAFFGCEDLGVVYNLCGLNLSKNSTTYGYIAFYAYAIIYSE